MGVIMAIRVAAVWFNMPACIAAKNETHVNAERDKRIRMELMPQGLLVRVQGYKRPFLVGNSNIRSMELYEEEPVIVPPEIPQVDEPEQPEVKRGPRKSR
jgi:hypothetical protein